MNMVFPISFDSGFTEKVQLYLWKTCLQSSTEVRQSNRTTRLTVVRASDRFVMDDRYLHSKKCNRLRRVNSTSYMGLILCELYTLICVVDVLYTSYRGLEVDFCATI